MYDVNFHRYNQKYLIMVALYIKMGQIGLPATLLFCLRHPTKLSCA